ncbi:PREDICTED: olfactory receptor 2A12-like [Cyprinodon variegatus]|uniref:olfactory receptor 2A12-like n=1 Tax=Cyprinodon variegatus TaxID=28743 RepID=UPI00074256FF|nr:PREDICTED: olfactory receptor 2A12-like [Cyprinodon variegatus]
MENASTIFVFFLSGLNETSRTHRSALFFFCLLCYCITILANVSLILIIILDKTLHEPMYILLCAFCFNALYGTTGFYPKFLWDLLSPVHIISYSGCLFQTQVFYSFAFSDFSILAFMAYDRYLAICHPLDYHSIMSMKRVIWMTCSLWLTSFFIIGVNSLLTFRLKLCSPYINRLFCVNWSIVSLAYLPQALQNFIAMEFLVVPPLMNPLIYGFKLPLQVQILGRYGPTPSPCSRRSGPSAAAAGCEHRSACYSSACSPCSPFFLSSVDTEENRRPAGGFHPKHRRSENPASPFPVRPQLQVGAVVSTVGNKKVPDLNIGCSPRCSVWCK